MIFEWFRFCGFFGIWAQIWKWNSLENMATIERATNAIDLTFYPFPIQYHLLALTLPYVCVCVCQIRVLPVVWVCRSTCCTTQRWYMIRCSTYATPFIVVRMIVAASEKQNESTWWPDVVWHRWYQLPHLVKLPLFMHWHLVCNLYAWNVYCQYSLLTYH